MYYTKGHGTCTKSGSAPYRYSDVTGFLVCFSRFSNGRKSRGGNRRHHSRCLSPRPSMYSPPLLYMLMLHKYRVAASSHPCRCLLWV